MKLILSYKNHAQTRLAESLVKAEGFVLQKFSDAEKEKIEKVLKNVLEEIKKYL